MAGVVEWLPAPLYVVMPPEGEDLRFTAAALVRMAEALCVSGKFPAAPFFRTEELAQGCMVLCRDSLKLSAIVYRITTRDEFLRLRGALEQAGHERVIVYATASPPATHPIAEFNG